MVPYELQDTVILMKSDNYKERFLAEYLQTKIRYEKLHRMLVKYDAGKLEYKPYCPVDLLRKQEGLMWQYLYTLETRAEIEEISLEIRAEVEEISLICED